MLLACAVFFWMNMLTPLKEDDMEFTILGRGPLLNALRFPYDNFMSSDARFSDLVAVLFCGFMGKTLFNVFNTLVFGLMAHLLSLLSVGRRSVLVLSLFLAFVGCCYPVPGETMLFVAGSCNYLWAITASLLLIWYLLRFHGIPLSRGKSVLLFIGAFIAGNFNEATSFAFFAGLCLYYAFNRQQWTRVVMIAMAGYLLGILVILFSPGAWDRAANGGIVVDLALSDLLYSRCVIFLKKMLHFVTPVAAVVIGIAALLMRHGKDVRKCIWTYILPCAAILMFALGMLNDRPYAPLATVGFIIFSMGIHYLLDGRNSLRLTVIVLALALSGLATAHAMRMLKEYKTYEDRNMSEIASAPRQAILRERHFNGHSRFVTALRYASSEYFVRENIYCAFYDKDNLQFVSDSVYDRYHSGRLLSGATVMSLTSDRPDVVGIMYSFPDQDYMVAELRVDSLPFTTQQARYYNKPQGTALSDNDKAFRRRYGLSTDYTPYGFYPLRYQGKLLLIFPSLHNDISHVVFPIDGNKPPTEVTLTNIPAPNSRD